MDRKQIISRSLNKINEKFCRVFEWLTCADLGRDWDGAGDPYNTQSVSKSSESVGRGAQSVTKDSKIVKDS